MWNQVADENLIDPKKTKKEWVTAPGACEGCEELSGVRVGLNESWDTEWGALKEPPAHPNCSCSYEVIPHIL